MSEMSDFTSAECLLMGTLGGVLVPLCSICWKFLLHMERLQSTPGGVLP